PNVRTGGIGFYENTDSENIQYEAKSTHLLGSHEIRYGFSYEDIAYDAIQQRTGPPITLSNGETLVTGVSRRIIPDPVFGRIYRATRGSLANVRDTTQNYWSLFVQDQFGLGDHLTLNLGLRYEQQKLEGNLTEFTWDNNWAPRVGAIYDPTGDGRAKIYGNYGRFFAKVPNDLAARAMAADAGITRADYFDEAMTDPVPEGVLAGEDTRHLILAGLSPAEFDPDSKTSYLDEAIAGFEFEAAPELNLGVRYIWRDLGRVLEDVGTASLTLYLTNPEELESVEYFITNIDPSIPTVNNQGAFEKPERNYQAVEFTMDKRVSNNWGLFASYRWSRLYGNFEGFFRSDNGQSDPGITSLFDFPTNDPTYVALAPVFGFRGDIRLQGELGAGRLPNDREHQIKAYSTYSFDNGLGLGIGLLVGSGKPLTPLASNPVYDNAGEIPEAVRGAGLETVDGFRERTEFHYGLDLHADYRINFAETAGVTLIADVFNVFNQQTTLRANEFTELSFGVLDPDTGRALAFADPFSARFGVRVDF
ncbi:MAG: TonB-dependent receptor domain-containing protein, partial [Vicinamibacteria bacterium]